MLTEESIGVIFSAIGKELSLPILCEVTKLKVADWDEPFNHCFHTTSSTDVVRKESHKNS